LIPGKFWSKINAKPDNLSQKQPPIAAAKQLNSTFMIFRPVPHFPFEINNSDPVQFTVDSSKLALDLDFFERGPCPTTLTGRT
jgi:hypothetical protein